MKVAIYTRVSTEDQADRGTVENQVIFANKYCDLHQLDIFNLYKEEGISGTIPLIERPQGKQLIKDAKNKKFDTLLVYKLDRLGRSARVTLNSIYELESYGIQIKSMTEPFDTSNPSGRFMITMLAGVADLERETILERMWHGANRAARDGKWLGGVIPYGYCLDANKRLQIDNTIIPEINLSEADIVRLIFDMIANKKYSSVKLAGYLNALGVPTSSKVFRRANIANIWRPNNLSRMLRNTTYKGIHYYGKRSKKKRELIPREVPAIVDEDIWERAQEVLKNNQIESTKNAKRSYLLRGLIKCGCCKSTYSGASYGGNKVYYVCNRKLVNYVGPSDKKCNSKNIPAEYIENLIWEDVVNFINNPGEAIKALQDTIDESKAETKNIELERSILEKNIEENKLEIQSILDLYRKKRIDAADLDRQLDKIQKEKEMLEKSLADLEKNISEDNELTKKFNTAEELLINLKEKLQGEITFEVKREIIKSLVKEVNVSTVGDGRNKTANIDIKYCFVKDVTHTDMDS